MNDGTQMRITESDKELLRRTFGGNDELLKLLRKIFLPELDPTLPIQQMIDLWMTTEIKDKSPEECKIQMIARNTVIAHIEFQLGQIKIMANSEEETPAQTAKRVMKDSSK